MGDGLPPVPKKLHQRTLKVGVVQPELEPQPVLEVVRPWKKPIESIAQWIWCFAIYVAVLATEFCCSGPTHIYGHHASTERVRRASLEIV